MKVTATSEDESTNIRKGSGKMFKKDVTTGVAGGNRVDVVSIINGLKDNRGFVHKALGYIMEDLDKQELRNNFAKVKESFEKYKEFNVKLPDEIVRMFEYQDGTPIPLSLGGAAYINEEEADKLIALAKLGEKWVLALDLVWNSSV